jgi:hypothetical protein
MRNLFRILKNEKLNYLHKNSYLYTPHKHLHTPKVLCRKQFNLKTYFLYA